MTEKQADKIYLGDGVYAFPSNSQVWIYTSDGIAVQDEIALEPEVMAALIHYAAKIYGSEFIKREARRYMETPNG